MRLVLAEALLYGAGICRLPTANLGIIVSFVLDRLCDFAAFLIVGDWGGLRGTSMDMLAMSIECVQRQLIESPPPHRNQAPPADLFRLGSLPGLLRPNLGRSSCSSPTASPSECSA